MRLIILNICNHVHREIYLRLDTRLYYCIKTSGCQVNFNDSMTQWLNDSMLYTVCPPTTVRRTFVSRIFGGRAAVMS